MQNTHNNSAQQRPDTNKLQGMHAQQLLQMQLQREIASREALLTCLKAERQAMELHDSTQLMVSVEEKARVLQEVEQLAKHRLSLVADLPGLHKKLQPLAATSEDARRICAYCECLQTLSQEIVQSNEVNARLNARGQQIIRKLLTILRGQDTQATLYNQLGHAAAGRHDGYTVTQA